MDGSPQQALRAWAEYLRDMGLYDLYRRESPGVVLPAAVREELLRGSNVTTGEDAPRQNAEPGRSPLPSSARPARPVPPSPLTLSQVSPERTQRTPGRSAGAGIVQAHQPERAPFFPEAERPILPPELAAPMPKPNPLEMLAPPPAIAVAPAEKAAALERLRNEIGDCTRCPLAYAGRHTVVFGEGDPNAALLFVGEGPGADEDATGRPFVGKAGQLLTNMIGAMGLTREQVFIANIVKCRPPGNRAPEVVEATTCSQFLLQQIDIVQPKVIVALGSTAATYVLGVRQSLSSLRGEWFRSRGAKVAVTYHPAFLLRDPRQKGEAWKDLQRVMVELGLAPAGGERKA